MKNIDNQNHPDMLENSNDNRHTRLLKFFTFSSIMSMILILTLVGLNIHILLNNFLLTKAENDAINIGLVLVDQEKETLIDMDGGGNSYLNIEENELGPFNKRVRISLEIFNISKLKIYDLSKRIIYSTDSEIIGISDPVNTDLEYALSGGVTSKFQRSKGLWDLNEEEKEGFEMVETYLPIRTGEGNILGVFEIYMDVGSYRSDAKTALLTVISILLIVLFIVFGLLRIFMHQAIKTIYAKSQNIRILKGLLPICSFCKKIKNGVGEWENLENYITQRTASQFSHGLCPDCRREQYPDI